MHFGSKSKFYVVLYELKCKSSGNHIVREESSKISGKLYILTHLLSSSCRIE